MNHKLILASASKARLGVLKSAGITPKILVSNIDEEKIINNLSENIFNPKLQVNLLALAKALEIIKQIYIHTYDKKNIINPTNTDNNYKYENEILLIACDSMLEFEGKMLGKPKEKNLAISRAKNMRGKTTVLHTGHMAIKLTEKILKEIKIESLQLSEIKTEKDLNYFINTCPLEIASNCDSTKVTFSNSSDKEIEDYVATGEPLFVAGGFTIDGYGSAFIEKIEGDYNNVIGISPRIIRNLCTNLGLEYTSLWD